MADDRAGSPGGETAKAIAKPLYKDAVQPLAREVGEALGTVGATVNAALLPLRLAVWGFDQIEEFLRRRLEEKLKDVPPEDVVTPPPNVAGPAAEALRFASHEPDLREMYANLLATAMTRRVTNDAHPAFVEMLRQMTGDEARLLQYLAEHPGNHPLINVYAVPNEHENRAVLCSADLSLVADFAGCADPTRVGMYLNNLSRLGIIQIQRDEFIVPATPDALNPYEGLEKHPRTCRLHDAAVAQHQGHKIISKRGLFRLTPLGEQFLRACVPESRRHDRVT